jgi:hypothetical protein
MGARGARMMRGVRQLNVEWLLAGAGGGGQAFQNVGQGSAGGGGGEVKIGSFVATRGESRSVSIGVGGQGGVTQGQFGSPGGASSITGVASCNGGQGGGSGGLGGTSGSGQPGAANTTGANSNNRGGGGGGATGPGLVPDGGQGLSRGFDGATKVYGNGGGGTNGAGPGQQPYPYAGAGGVAGATDGVHYGQSGSPGNSGVAMFRYLGPQRLTGGLVSSITDPVSGAQYTLHVFTSAGAFAWP